MEQSHVIVLSSGTVVSLVIYLFKRIFSDLKGVSTKISNKGDELNKGICALEAQVAALTERLNYLEGKK